MGLLATRQDFPAARQRGLDGTRPAGRKPRPDNREWLALDLGPGPGRRTAESENDGRDHDNVSLARDTIRIARAPGFTELTETDELPAGPCNSRDCARERIALEATMVPVSRPAGWTLTESSAKASGSTAGPRRLMNVWSKGPYARFETLVDEGRLKQNASPQGKPGVSASTP